MTRARIHALAVAAALAALVAAGCGGSGDSNDALGDDVVAVVDGVEITKARFDEFLNRSKTQARINKQDFPKVGTAEYRALQTNIVTYLVRRTENEKEAAALGIAITDAEVKERLDQIKEQLGGETKFRAAVKQQGLTVDAVRDDIRGQLLSQKLVDQLTQDVKVAEAEAKKYYEDNKTQYAVPESRDVRHILLAVKKTNGSNAAVDFAKSKAQAEDVYRQLEAGADFAALAKKYSQDPGSKDAGGKLTITKGQTVPPFEKTSFSLETGELSQPVKTQFGFHLIEALTDVKAATTTPFADVKAQIEAQLADTKRNDVIEQWSKDVEKKYEDKISYAKGYAPAPAASTETTG
jgi:parvulin-like peptidyl-prolyl isomerase